VESANVGTAVGEAVRLSVGESDGAAESANVGTVFGEAKGALVGASDGALIGALVTGAGTFLLLLLDFLVGAGPWSSCSFEASGDDRTAGSLDDRSVGRKGHKGDGENGGFEVHHDYNIVFVVGVEICLLTGWLID